MSSAFSSATVRFTTKGQVVIPNKLRKEFQIEPGTRATVTATADGILLKPITARAIQRMFGILKRPGEKPWAEQVAEHKAEERALEDRRERLLMGEDAKRNRSR